MARGDDVERHVRLAFDVNDFRAVLRIDPALRGLVLPLRIELFDEIVFHGRADVGESPADPLVVADDHERNSGQRHARHVEVRRFEVRFEPEVRHLVVEVHIVREKRLSGNCVLTGNNPVVRSGTEGICSRHTEGRVRSRCEIRRSSGGFDRRKIIVILSEAKDLLFWQFQRQQFLMLA